MSNGANAALKEAPNGEGYRYDHPLAARIKVVDAVKGVIEPSEGFWRKKIAICGFASSSRYAILDRCQKAEWEIWGLNQLYRHIPRADRWFDIHWNWDQETVPGTDYRGWAKDCGIPFYMKERVPEMPTSLTYPIDLVIKNGNDSDYFTSTIAYGVGLAILEIDFRVRHELQWALGRRVSDIVAYATEKDGDDDEATLRTTPPIFPDVPALMRSLYQEYTIGVYGVDLTVGSEYFHEKACAEYWLGQAVARNIQVEIPKESALCKSVFGRYGYPVTTSQLLMVNEVREHQAAVKTERDEQLKRLYMLEGAIETDERWAQLLELRERGTRV